MPPALSPLLLERLRKKPGTSCLLGPSCALCWQRHLGSRLRPLTTKEWRAALREGEDSDDGRVS